MLLDDIHVHDSDNHGNTNLGGHSDSAMGHSMSQVDPTHTHNNEDTKNPNIDNDNDKKEQVDPHLYSMGEYMQNSSSSDGTCL